MKLKNKRSGEIKEAADVIIENMNKNGSTLSAISIDEIKEEWEDYEEPKAYWYIDCYGSIQWKDDRDSEWDEHRKQIGDYFETEEEALATVEKLKAWKRLKDKGFRFERWCFSKEEPKIIIKGNCVPDIVEELDLLFGGSDGERAIDKKRKVKND